MDSWVKGVIAVTGAMASYLFGGWSSMLETLLMFAFIDYLSGLTAAAMAGEISSSIGMRGIAKKIAVFAVVAIAHVIDQALGEAHLIRDAAIWWYLANELVSIIENAGRMGVPIPPAIKRAVASLNDRGGGKK
jgi:toxin secretion/phage lysis holin